MPIQQTTSLRKIAALKKPIKVIRGSQGAAKTISILIILINHASSKPNREILILSAELTKMRLTVIKDFVKVMREAGLYDENRFLAGTLYKFPNGSFVKFIGLDKEDVGKGLRSHVAYFNEVNKIDQETYRQVASRAEKVYADYNPDVEFFIDTDVIPREDCDFLQLTFQDNELLSDRERGEILRYKDMGYNPDGSIKNTYWANKWQVYGLGNIGSIDGVVFENWDIIDEVPKEAELAAYGLDWGFSADPTGLAGVYKWNKDLVIDELIYQTGLTNSKLVALMDQIGIDKYTDIIADSSDPKSIQDLKDLGYPNTFGAKKGPDSVEYGISKMQEFKIWITKRSVNTIKEFRAYRWATDINGKSTGKPIDKNNHIIDPARYVTTDRVCSEDYFEIG
jgi:phage terminase large subunit